MARQIKFRGLLTSTKKWLIGDLYKDNYSGKCFITEFIGIKSGESITELREVMPESVGQFTGFIAEKCKTNLEKEIYEGDIFRETTETDNGDVYQYHVVVWVRQRGAFSIIPKGCYEDFMQNDLSDDPHFDWLFEHAQLYDFSIDVGLTKVGNIHESEVTND